MVKVATTPFDSAGHVRTPEEISLYLSDALESMDASVIAAALGTLARARGASTVQGLAGEPICRPALRRKPDARNVDTRDR
jgi:probable addiction module antidote protein